MHSYRLSATEGTQSFDLPANRAMVVGRGVSSDIALYDPTISRRHAELTAGPDGVHVRDLGSSNGTAINGARVAVQGFGAVGKHAARFLTAKGARLVAASDSEATIHDPSGIDVEALIRHKSAGHPIAA